MLVRTSALRLALSSACLLAGTISSVYGQGLGEALEFEPPSWILGSYEIGINGSAAGSVFASNADSGPLSPGGYSQTDATGLLRGRLTLERIYDSGLMVGFETWTLLARDELSRDAYGNDFFQKAFFYVRTGLGQVDIGQQDGAAYQIGFTGPQVDPYVSLENPAITFFRNPQTGEGFNTFTGDVTVVNSSSNAAKIAAVSPRLFGVQVGFSYTPDLVKGFPLLGNPPNGPNVQASLFEIAGSYLTELGNVDTGISLGLAHGALRNPAPGASDLFDWSLGLEFAADAGEWELFWGGGFRGSNGYGFMPGAVLSGERSRRLHLSFLGERGPWIAGGEFSDTQVDAPAGTPEFTVKGYQVAAGYRINDNMQVTLGWQRYEYDRDIGIFYNGNSGIGMDAAFLTLGYGL